MSSDLLREKIAELRRLATASRHRVHEIASGLEGVRRELREVSSLLSPRKVEGAETEPSPDKEFDERADTAMKPKPAPRGASHQPSPEE